METYQTAAPVEYLRGKSAEEAELAPSYRGGAGGAMIGMVGEAAQVGESHEWWWAANRPAFAPCVDGSVEFEMRVVRLRYDSPGAKIRKIVKRAADGQQMAEIIAVDWEATRDEMHNKGWLRVDPVVREMGITETGMPSRLMTNRPDKMREIIGADGPMCDPIFLAAVGVLNQVEYSQAFIQKFESGVIAGLEPFFTTFGRTAGDLERRREILIATHSNCQKIREALEGAAMLMGGEQAEPPTTPLKKLSNS